MTWVRLDDKFPSHPKVSQLTDREFRVHIRVLCYCAEYDTRGELEAGVWNEIPGLTKPIGRKFVALGIWDEDGSGRLTVHEFEQFNARSLEERVEAYLRAHPEASANEVHRTVGGTRQVVLDLVQSVRRRFDNGSDPGTGGGSPVPPKPVRPVVPKPVPAPSTAVAPKSSSTSNVNKGSSRTDTSVANVLYGELPAHKEILIVRALDHLRRDPLFDTNTPNVVRYYATTLSESSIARAYESTTSRNPKSPVRYFVAALKREGEEAA